MSVNTGRAAVPALAVTSTECNDFRARDVHSLLVQSFRMSCVFGCRASFTSMLISIRGHLNNERNIVSLRPLDARVAELRVLGAVAESTVGDGNVYVFMGAKVDVDIDDDDMVDRPTWPS